MVRKLIPEGPDWRRTAGIVALSAFTTALVLAASAMMFSRFMLYDDEGYVLLSLKNFAEHGRLYGDVYTQYGPLPYVACWLAHLLGVPIIHTAGRVVTILAWGGTVFASGLITWRATRSFTLVATVIASVFIYLWVMVSEPSHPGGLITLITAGLACAGASRLAAERNSAWAFLVGAGVAALILTKINVGVFAAISAGAFFVLNARDDRVQHWSPWIIAAGFIALPWLLMRPLLHAAWVQTFAAIFSLSAATATGAVAVSRERVFGLREFRMALLGGISVAVVVLAVVLGRGTTPDELLEGMLLGPLSHPIHFSLVFKWAPLAIGTAVISAGLCALAFGQRQRGRKEASDTLVAGLRLVAALGLLGTLLRFPAISADNIVLSYGLPCIWFFLWPLNTETAMSIRSRAWIGLLALGQFLHPFPVPGSQIAWGTFLTLPLAAIGGWQAAQFLAPRLRLAPRARPVFAFSARLGLATAAGFIGFQLAQIGRQYFDGRTLALPGAEMIRLPDESTARYQILSFNALAHTDMLFSLPGMFSFNLWTGLPTPTLANVTHWFSLLQPDQQRGIIQSLEAHPRAAVIVETGHVDFLRQRGLAPAGILFDYIEQNYEPAFAFDGMEFRVRKGRHVAAYFAAEVFRRPSATADPGVKDSDNTQLVIPLLLPAERAIASVEIISLGGRAARLTLRADNTRIEATPITQQGDPRGPRQAATFPLKLDGPTSVAFYFDGRGRLFDLRDTLIVLHDAAGADLGLVRLRP